MLGPALIGLAGAGLGYMGQERTNQAQQDAARDQMAFQREMSNTAYQRAMIDMRKAGLNPILAGKLGPASSPSGAMPVFGNPMSQAVTSGSQAMQTMSNVQLQDASSRLKTVQSNLAKSLEPGAKATEIVMENVKDAIEAVDDAFKNPGTLGEQIAKSGLEAAGAFLDKLIGAEGITEAQKVANKILKNSEMSKETEAGFKQVLKSKGLHYDITEMSKRGK